MRLLIQRTDEASVTIDNEITGAIKKGLLVLIGIVNEDTKDDIDFFATYHQGKVYLIPVEECSGATKTIRYTPPKNGQRKGISFAEDYLAEEVLKKL